MAVAEYQYFFNHADTVQWLFDLQQLQNILQQHTINSPKALEQFLQKHPDFHLQARQELTVIAVNQAALKLYNCDSKEQFNQYLRTAVSKEQLKHLFTAILSAGETVNHYVYQAPVSIAGDEKSLLVSCIVPALNDFDKGISVSIVDITSLAEAQKDVAEREQFLGAILKAVPDILLVYDFEQQITLFQNIDLIERLGYSAEEVEESGNQLLNYIIHPDDNLGTDAIERIYQTLAEGGTFEVTIRLQHADGNWRHFFFRSAALDKNAQGDVLTAVVVVRDITDILATQQILFEQQRLYRLMADNFSDVIITTDTELTITYVSPSLALTLGYDMESFIQSPSPLSLIGLDDHMHWFKDLLKHVPARFDFAIADQEATLELNALTAAGYELPIEMKVSILRDEYGWLEGLLIVVRDASERLKREAENRLAAKVFENSLEGVYITNADGLIAQVNDAFCQITGFSQEDVLGKKPSLLSSGWRDTSFKADIEPILTSEGSWSGEIMSRRADGEAFLTWMSISEVRDGRNQLVGIITSFRDITEAKSSEESIRKLAYYDALTELPNRQLFQDRLSQALQSAKRNRHFVALLYMDLDGFKPINDEYGHAIGDRLLAIVAKRLKACVRGDDTVARLGGDEFAIVLPAQLNSNLAESAAMQVAKKVIHSLNQAVDIQEYQITIGCSIGIAIFPSDAGHDEQLIKLADAAMYHAKSAGKNNYQFYTADMYQRAQKRLMLEKEIESAINNQEFLLFYQAKLGLESGKIQAAEALLRWQHPSKGFLMPEDFIHHVDQLGLGHKVGAWVVQQVCRHMQQCPALHVSINVFNKHYREGDLYRDIQQAVAQYQIEPQRLTLEISESLVMADTDYALQLIEKLKSLGVRIALDDYASGMLSIGYLNQLSINEVKIDRQFINGINESPRKRQFVEGISALAKIFGLDVTVEGVENEQQLGLLKHIHCNYVQGYLFSKPVLLNELIRRYYS